MKSHRKLMFFRRLFGMNFEDEGATGVYSTRFRFVMTNLSRDLIIYVLLNLDSMPQFDEKSFKKQFRRKFAQLH